jgi:DNA modification methylase
VDINKLKLNPFHSKIYLTNEIDDLVDSIKESGLLEKIVVNSDLVIISGARRLLALKKLNYKKVDVIVKDVKSNDELLTLISFNKQRIKTNREILNEAKYLKQIWGKRRGRKSISQKQIGSSSEPVDTRKRISETVKISAGNLSMLEYIDNVKPELINEIDKGKVSIKQVYTGLKNFQEQKKVLAIEETQPTTITNDWYTIINKSSDDLSDLEDSSIQVVVTSPPYWQQRSFTNISDELGSEKTSEEFVQRMANHLHACHRVLKPEGSFFLNLGDTFHKKCLQSIPHRVVIELVRKGWILRNTIVWKKTNSLPSTTKDNLTTSYEFIFHLVKSINYYYNNILVPLSSKQKVGINIINQKSINEKSASFGSICISGLRQGKKLEDYWTEDIIHTAGASQSIVRKYGAANHPAPFPSDVVIPPILATSKPGDTVLDIFSGTATTGHTAILLGRKYVGYELNANHNEIQTKILDAAVKTYNETQELSDISQAA